MDATEYNHKRLQDARTLRALVEAEQDDDADGVDLLLLTLLDTSIRDQEFNLGLIECPYSHDLQRRTFLQQILHTTDKILDKLADYADGEPLPPAGIGLCKFLFELTYPTFLLMQEIETAHPDLAKMFTAQRDAYTATR